MYLVGRSCHTWMWTYKAGRHTRWRSWLQPWNDFGDHIVLGSMVGARWGWGWDGTGAIRGSDYGLPPFFIVRLICGASTRSMEYGDSWFLFFLSLQFHPFFRPSIFRNEIGRNRGWTWFSLNRWRIESDRFPDSDWHHVHISSYSVWS